jgi:uncharacterized phage protein (TIGR02216 family)
MAHLNWPALYRVALRDLGLSLSDFWSLTPHELTMIYDAQALPGLVLRRSDLEALMAQFPDHHACPKG